MLPLQLILGPSVVHPTPTKDFLIIYLHHSYKQQVLHPTMSLLCSPPALVVPSPGLRSWADGCPEQMSLSHPLHPQWTHESGLVLVAEPRHGLCLPPSPLSEREV